MSRPLETYAFTSQTKKSSALRRSPSPEPMQQYTPPPSSPGICFEPRRGPEPVQARRFYVEVVAERFPDLPLNGLSDFEVYHLAIAEVDSERTLDDVRRIAGDRWRWFVEECGGIRKAQQIWEEYMNEEVEPTGRKPEPGDPYVDILPIPGTSYSLRFWPGSLTWAEYCMDFVEDTNHQGMVAVNVPAGYKVWAIPDPDHSPWLFPTCTQLESLERSYGIPPEKIIAGEEKYLLRDGLVCSLVYEDREVLRFQVPKRQGANPVEEDVAEIPVTRLTGGSF
ncbi:hypothetical protein PYCCODRAFT_1432593 [Trametes coccinea BRFM310]|uniref:Uncharacterized protein n=1 Tax=Trametes coccinea (strain BRFM310) TaxID=1353009 RepID=A0A1Y2IWE9_TRAC3|nr:hypothetical protein PYCCODRAFT_1432593 [Trametes coccinea BRFM310]